MAKEYFEKLSKLINDLRIDADIGSSLEIKHFFSGAALYINGRICVTWSPVGLAFKLSQSEVSKLIESGEAIPLKYFPKGNIKKGYALFENPGSNNPSHWKNLFIKAAHHAY
jgi:hypothetical protein